MLLGLEAEFLIRFRASEALLRARHIAQVLLLNANGNLLASLLHHLVRYSLLRVLALEELVIVSVLLLTNCFNSVKVVHVLNRTWTAAASLMIKLFMDSSQILL